MPRSREWGEVTSAFFFFFSSAFGDIYSPPRMSDGKEQTLVVASHSPTRPGGQGSANPENKEARPLSVL